MNMNCFKHSGDCSCVTGVRGKKCDSLFSSRPLYFPTLYQMSVELERAVLTTNSRVWVPIGADENRFPSYSGTGYAIFPAYKPYYVTINIPKTRQYRIIFHYALKENLHASARVDLAPRGSKISNHTFEVQFSPPKPGAQQTKNLTTTVNRRGLIREFDMKKGAWNIIITSHSSMLLLDYIVFLPEDYYKAELLKDVSSEPCLLRTSKPEHCDMYTYYEPKSPSIITVSGDKAYTLPLKGNPDIFIDPRFDLRDQRLSNMALLGNIQPSIGFDISVPESGHYVIMVTYLHPERFTQRAFVRVGYERGHLEILPCKYQFACRQFAMDDNKKPKSFELTASPDKHELKLESSVSSKIAMISITVIPLAKWNIQYIQPTFQCRMYNKSCVSTTYDIPPDAIQLAAFSRRIQDKMITILTGAVRPKTIYYVIVYYKQPQSLSTRVEQILIADQVKSNISVTFQYCPARSGCRIVLGEEDGRRFQFSKGVFTATIEHDRRTQVGHVLLVPQGSYSTRLLEPQSIDRVQQFIQSCGKDHFHIDPGQAGRMCREGVFTLTIGFNGQPLQCKCSLLGSRSVFCEKFGGQCLCRANVVGRRCDRCRLGYSGFPRCRSCGCHEIGSVSPTCTSSGRCRCKPGFGGYKCDRCRSSGYYGFPDCKPCACNSLGSLSMFCRSRDGQCQCRRKFQGQKCNECRIGFYDFPRCKACGCNPAGIKLLPGQTNGCGSVNNTHCVCKNNVAGDDCDSCKPFTFNLQMKNPLGCQSCDCNANGTLGSIKTCHATIGQCECKSHVTGRQCGRCKDGYHSFKGSDMFGCKRCLCNAGGSVSQSCNAVTGACTCLHGIGGTQCDRVASQEYYYPTLYHHKVELEDGFTGNDAAANFRHSESEFTGFSWRGYVVFTQSQNFIYIMIDVPRTTKYQLIFHYNYISYLPVTAMVKFIPTLDSASFPDGPAREQTLDVQFRSTSSWIFAVPKILLVRDYRWEPRRVMLSQGKWKLTMAVTASDLFVDYLVLLPEEYYSPRNLALKVTKPCTLSRDEKYCVHYTYPTLKKEGIVTIQAEDSSVVGGIRRSQRVGDVPFQGRLLSGSRNVMSVRLPSTVRGQFVLLASYFYNSDDERRLSVVVRTGDEIFRAQLSILSCRYRFGCRQVAIDSNHGAYMFTAKPDEITTVSLTSNFMVALDFISAIPLSMWNEKLLIPAEQCVDNGFSCIQTSYPDPSDATKIEVEDRSTGGDIAPYYIMDRRARLKHVKVGKKTVFIHGTARSGRYYVIVHFYQPNFLTFPGKVIISGQNAATTLFTFHHCPHVSGCRAIGTSQYREGISESIYIGRQNNIILSITIPEDKGLWIDYVMLVPLSSFSPSLLEIEPIDVNRDFIQDCGQNDFFLKESSSKFCLTSTFTITSKFNNGALPCQCDRLGSAKTGCRAFGGQCSCRPNVIGRACDRCKSGYSGFPLCRKPIT